MKTNADLIFKDGVPATHLSTLLSIPFPGQALSLRPGSVIKEFNHQKFGKRPCASVLVYYDKQKAQEELDRRIGTHNWNSEIQIADVTKTDKRMTAAVKCTISIKTDMGIISRQEVGEGDAVAGNEGEFRGNTEVVKSAATDAFRRACAAFGLGRIYYMKSKNVYHPINNYKFFMFGYQDPGTGSKIDFGSQEILLREMGYMYDEDKIVNMIEQVFDNIRNPNENAIQ
jgi:hypothetical protein